MGDEMSGSSDEEVEKVARAICKSRSGPFSRWEGREDEYRTMARAAIAAIGPQAPAAGDKHGPYHHVTQNEKELCEVCMKQDASPPSSEGKLREAAEGIDTFAWSCVRTDCDESREELGRRIAAIRSALSPNKPSPDDGREGSG